QRLEVFARGLGAVGPGVEVAALAPRPAARRHGEVHFERRAHGTSCRGPRVASVEPQRPHAVPIDRDDRRGRLELHPRAPGLVANDHGASAFSSAVEVPRGSSGVRSGPRAPATRTSSLLIAATMAANTAAPTAAVAKSVST